MTIIVEDGTIVANSNSYASEAQLTSFALARGITLVLTEEQLLIQAMDYTESQKFQGGKATQDQSLQWPRTGVSIDGFAIGTREIPKELITAQLTTAIAIDQGNSPEAVLTAGIKKEKVDVIETEYQDNAISAPIDPKVSKAFSKLLAFGGSMFNPVVVRA